MLASWLRIKYPAVVDGAVAASAPIWGFPLTSEAATNKVPLPAFFPFSPLCSCSCPLLVLTLACVLQVGNPPGPTKVTGSSAVLAHAASVSGPEGAASPCATNILAAQILTTAIGKTADGLAAISKAFGTCKPLKGQYAAEQVVSYIQGPWFDMSEGDYPFPSTYITYSVGPGLIPLPAWPLRVACAKGANTDHGVKFNGADVSMARGYPTSKTMHYDVDVGGLKLAVEWNNVSITSKGSTADMAAALEVIKAAGEAVGVWYNLTGKLKCWDPASSAAQAKQSSATQATTAAPPPPDPEVKSRVCTGSNKGWSNAQGWGPLCCNEGLHLVNTDVNGAGDDMFWPPEVTPSWTPAGIVTEGSSSPGRCGSEYDSEGLFGLPTFGSSDPWSRWENAYYGGLRLHAASNIIFSNGELDPWSAAGVYGPNRTDFSSKNGVETVMLDQGGHHLDLMFSVKDAPPCFKAARARETASMKRWIAQHDEAWAATQGLAQEL